jgi:hypothetical protein
MDHPTRPNIPNPSQTGRLEERAPILRRACAPTSRPRDCPFRAIRSRNATLQLQQSTYESALQLSECRAAELFIFSHFQKPIFDRVLQSR